MLFFICNLGRFHGCVSSVSIHLMLFFIPSLGRHEDLIRMFQYISCYSLSLLPVRHLPCVEVSIHLMLFFIRIAPSIFFPNASSFNTSHVILYRYDLTWGELTWEFQYISCYSLSNMFPARNKLCNMVSIHLMLFFIEWLVTMPLDDWSFNTSHVILYRRNERSEHDTEYVSIHLMLFFIEKEKTIAYDDSMFQYISCYSLSIIWILWVLCFLRFNTSHVILYPKKTSTTKTPE